MKIHNFLKQGRWINAPDFLWQPETEWPKFPKTVEEISEYGVENKTTHLTLITCALDCRLQVSVTWTCIDSYSLVF